jgi:hypothetical protein
MTRLYRTDSCSGDRLVPGNAGCYPKECRHSVGLIVQQYGEMDRYKWRIFLVTKLLMYRGADKSLARPGKKQVTATEDFEFLISYL